MSLARVYNAFIKAGVDQDTATLAMEALEDNRDEPWKRSIENRLARLEARILRLEWGMGVTISLLLILLALELRVF